MKKPKQEIINLLNALKVHFNLVRYNEGCMGHEVRSTDDQAKVVEDALDACVRKPTRKPSEESKVTSEGLEVLEGYLANVYAGPHRSGLRDCVDEVKKLQAERKTWERRMAEEAERCAKIAEDAIGGVDGPESALSWLWKECCEFIAKKIRLSSKR